MTGCRLSEACDGLRASATAPFPASDRRVLRRLPQRRNSLAGTRLGSKVPGISGGETASRSGCCSVEFEVLFKELRSLDDDVLRGVVQANETAMSLEFLIWLSDLEDDAEPEESQAINVLASQLVALREGLDPLSSAEIMSLSEQMQPGDLARDNLSIGHGQQAGSSFAAKVRRAASLALSPEGSRLLDKKVEELRAGMEAAKQQSALELMGRKALPTLDEARAVEHAAASADASGRILAVLVEMETRDERRASLPDAFTPPKGPMDSSYLEAEEGEEEMLYTTPFALLAAVDMELARFRRQLADLPQASTLLPGNVTQPELQAVLQSLREDIYDYLDRQGIA
eukprot:CAMPEP_0117657144 /NCGR_PEP_ID=MMETSP0804-20121206/5177_1 /TAXON_ID=1074897 /ORGANISM="Tetraselmis astigmatica, Strain CCMP880" /LENGTH=342 /DNA_ID=CAMNT_0005463585 /DNA_START=54 /DNA_END=1082 /DNA_ORIENTATION=+